MLLHVLLFILFRDRSVSSMSSGPQKAQTFVRDCTNDLICCIKVHEEWYTEHKRTSYKRPISFRMGYSYEPLTSFDATLTRFHDTTSFRCHENENPKRSEGDTSSGPFYMMCDEDRIVRIISHVPYQKWDGTIMGARRSYCIDPTQLGSKRMTQKKGNCVDFPRFKVNATEALLAWVSLDDINVENERDAREPSLFKVKSLSIQQTRPWSLFARKKFVRHGHHTSYLEPISSDPKLGYTACIDVSMFSYFFGGRWGITLNVALVDRYVSKT